MATATTVIFPWRAEYSVGIPQIDAQHQGLVKLINDLHAAMTAGKGREAIASIIDQLIRYTESHFASEEAMLRQRGYSKLAGHQEVHKHLTKQVYELRDKFSAAKLSITIEVMHFLKSWLADHIMVHDQAYARELGSR